MGRRVFALMAVAAVLGAGCAKQMADPVTPRGAESVDPPVSPSLPTEWVAVFVVDDVQNLQDETQELMRTSAEHIAIAPIACWIGLSEALGNPQGESPYVAAVVASSQEELRSVVQAVGRETLFEGELPAMCTD